MWRLMVAVLVLVFAHANASLADEAPIAGTVRAVDPAARTLTVEAREHGRVRVVVIEIRPASRIVRTRRSSDPAKPGFVEQAVALEDIAPGFTVSVTTKHDGDREVAEVVKVLGERRTP